MYMELMGGPLDGAIIDGPPTLPPLVSVPTALRGERAMYYLVCQCERQKHMTACARFAFCGYDLDPEDESIWPSHCCGGISTDLENS